MPLWGCSAALREGETRYSSGTTPTDRQYTGQIEEPELGLYFYNARWYDPALGRFTQPDSIVPQAGSPLGWDRYAYTLNNPVNYTDPTGNMPDELGCRTEGCNLYNSKQSQQAINEELLANQRTWNGLPKKYQSILQSEGWTSSIYSQSEYANGGVTDVSWSTEDPFNIAYWSVVGLSRIRPTATALAEYFCLNDGDCTNETINIYNTANNKWPNGPQVINGLKYSYHALMRMLPEGLGGRGIPPSAVENAINNGYLEPSNVEGTVRAVYENVTIVWNYIDNVIVTVWKTGY